MSTALELSLFSPINSLENYRQAVSNIPMLSAEEEVGLAKRFHQESDLDAAKQLVLSHLRFVVKVARGYSGYGLPQADLIQEGNVGLMKAVKRFDPAVGVRLVSFAVHWIRAEIHEYILRNWRIVKVATTKAQRKLFFNLRGAKKRLGWMNHKEVNKIAEDLGVKAKTVLQMEERLGSRDASFDLGVDSDSETEHPAPSAYLRDQRYEPAAQLEAVDTATYQENQLRLALDKLDDRSRDIVSRRWLNETKTTLHELADQYGVSAERIRQLEKNAFKKLRLSIDL